VPLIPSTKTVLNVLDAIKRKFGDESGAQLTDTDIIRWINEGQLEIARKNKYTRTTVTTPSVAGQAAYSFVGTNILSIETLSYADQFIEGKSFEQVQEEYLNTSGPTTTLTSTAVPLVWYEYADSVYFWPIPTNAGDTIKLYVCTYPVAVTSSVDSLSIPDTLYGALLDWIMAQAYEMDDDLQSSQVKLQQHTNTINDAATLSRGVNNKTYPVVTVLVEDL
jgi:hypothetical protein